MRTVGIVAEYNPFHNGHAYQLEKENELTGADYAVVVMSGNFVQRVTLLSWLRTAGQKWLCVRELIWFWSFPYLMPQGAQKHLHRGLSPYWIPSAVWMPFVLEVKREICLPSCPMLSFLKTNLPPTGHSCRSFCDRDRVFLLPEAAQQRNI